MLYKIGASLACADQLNLEEEITSLMDLGIDLLHVDIMDGIFVNNYCFGTQIFDYLEKFKNIEIEVHLMVTDPFKSIDFFKGRHFNRLSFHIEASNNPIQTLLRIKNMKKKCGIAINAATHENTINYLYDSVDYILVMSVEAGFTGQNFIESTIEKVKEIREELNRRKLPKDIYVDGHIDEKSITLLSKAGANVFIGGSTGLFKKGSTIKDNYNRLEKALYK